ncbi:CpXC domain-containing protein [Pontiella sp.]|uniref:CpXC domain-containing protein n=1 Tax=Pontiella sp. TaxID=2837462 RepID=UPI0035689E5D
MSISRTINITCPGCGTQQDVRLYDAVNVKTEPELREALMQNMLNRIQCAGCDLNFRVDKPLLYNDPKLGVLIHWVPETAEMGREAILDEFEGSLERMNAGMPADQKAPSVRLVLTRVELVELIFMLEKGLNQRVVEYVKYSIYTRNPEKANPKTHRLLLNVEDSTDEEFCFVLQNAESQELGQILRYGRAAYDSMAVLYQENAAEFLEMFPGPLISARELLLEDAEFGL